MNTFRHHSTRDRNHDLLSRAHTVNGAVIDGVDGRVVEVQSRATEVLSRPQPWPKAVTIAGMPKREAADLLQRLGGALAEYDIRSARCE